LTVPIESFNLLVFIDYLYVLPRRGCAESAVQLFRYETGLWCECSQFPYFGHYLSIASIFTVKAWHLRPMDENANLYPKRLYDIVFDIVEGQMLWNRLQSHS
jgi:hypothetical protein